MSKHILQDAGLPQKHYFLVQLQTEPSGEIPFLSYAFNTEEAKKQAQRFIRLKGWKGRVGKVEFV